MKSVNSSSTCLFDIVKYLVDDHVGIIHEIEEVPRESGMPAFFFFFARACNTNAFCLQQNFGNTGGGSADRRMAMAKAIGEAVERYCAAIFDCEDLPLAAYASASFPCVSPGEFALHSKAQYEEKGFPFAPFDSDTLIRWTPAREAGTDELRYVPAAMVYVPYFHDVERGEQPIIQSISTGLACHGSIADASITAICEVIERDAFTMAWQAKLSMPRIRINSMSEAIRELVQRFERTGRSITLLDLTLDTGVPTILSVARHGSPEAPALVFAASSHLDPEQAARKSLEELAYTGLLAQHLKTYRPRIVAALRYDNIVEQDSHVHFYADHANAHLADFLFESSRMIEFAEIADLSTDTSEEDLRILIERVRGTGHKVLMADLTTPDIAELGLSVVRAIIPGFHPMFLGHRVRALGGRRLWEIPKALGYPGIDRATGDNPAPHPYP
jgi:ribosomal protein S12 methylthiotransferase accessory factor